MNQTLKNFAIEQIKEGLSKLPSEWVDKFKLMYGRNPDKRGIAQRNVSDTLAMSEQDVITEIPDEKLEWALSQVEASIKKLEKLQLH